MSTGISSSDFVGQWSLSFADIDFINSKPVAMRLGLAAQLKFFNARGFFADDGTLIANDAREYLAEQIGIRADELSGYDFGGRSARRHCAEILQYLGFRRMTRGDREALSCWIIGELCPSGQSVSAKLEAVFLWCRDRNIYGPSAKELERLVRSKRQQYLDGWLHEVSAALPPETVTAMESSVADAEGPTGFNTMKADAGRATLDNILEVTARLAFVRNLNLPRNMFSDINPAWIEHVARRVSGEKTSEMRRHTETRQLALYAVYLMARETAMTDAMVELLVETVHKIGTRSKRKVVGDIAKDVERVYGKERLLIDIATASIDDAISANQHTQLINALRGHLGEFGIVVAQGPANLTAVVGVLADETNDFPDGVREIGQLYLDQIRLLTEKIDGLMLKLREATKANQDMRRLCTVPGVGPVTVGAILAFAPDLRAFKSGRNFAAWLGLVPRQYSTGGKTRLGGVSKMGQTDIRKLLIVGVMSLIRWIVRKGVLPDNWLGGILGRKPRMVAAVALANKMARIIRAMMTREQNYRMA